MCDPVTATVLTVASIGVSAYGQIQAGQAAKGEAKYNAAVQRNNAIIQDRAAADAINRGANDAATIKQNVRKANATARANAAGSGTLVDTGSNLDILVQNAGMGELDAQTAMNNAQREAYGYQIKKNDALASADLITQKGNNAATAGYIGAGSSLLTGGSKIYDIGNDAGWWKN